MFHAAICDDVPGIRQELQQYFQRYANDSGIVLTVDEYCSGSALLAADYLQYDLIVLDVQMGEPNGIETARQIRIAGGNMTIIFFTNYVQYALEGYEVQAFRFLIKPLSYEQFASVAGKALQQLQKQQQDCLNIKQKDNTTRIPIAEICYAETERGHVILHMKNKETIVSSFTMKELEATLARHPFFRCHTAYLVNMDEIKKVTQQDVILQDGKAIPLSKHRKKEMKEALTNFWGDQFL